MSHVESASSHNPNPEVTQLEASQEALSDVMSELTECREQLAAERENAEKAAARAELAQIKLAAAVEALKKIKQVTDLRMIDQLADAALEKS